MIKYTKIVNSLSSAVPFVGPETLERKMDKIFDSRIGANESVFGPSKLALKAMKKATCTSTGLQPLRRANA